MAYGKVKKALLARRLELLGAIDDHVEAASHNTIDEEEDKQFERLEDEVLSALADTDRDEILRIEAALEKIEEGSYGICENCGTTIPEARLEVMPDAVLCVTCASAAEKTL